MASIKVQQHRKGGGDNGGSGRAPVKPRPPLGFPWFRGRLSSCARRRQGIRRARAPPPVSCIDRGTGTADPLKMGIRQSTPQKQYDHFKKLRREQVLRDMELYRNHYPDLKDDPNLNDNFLFYTNQLPLKPDGLLIDEIHTQWFGRYDVLESHHGYIQWLFPTRSKSKSAECQQLQLHEIRDITADPPSRDRVLQSYKLMLDFLGIRLLDDVKGFVARADNWEERFANLDRSLHNSLRITRILMSLGELGYEHLKYPLVEFLLKEVLKYRTLPNLQDSLTTYWINTLQDDNDRQFLVCVAKAVVDKFLPDLGDLLGNRHGVAENEETRRQLRGALISATRNRPVSGSV